MKVKRKRVVSKQSLDLISALRRFPLEFGCDVNVCFLVGVNGNIVVQGVTPVNNSDSVDKVGRWKLYG